MDKRTALDRLRNLDRDIVILRDIIAALGFDEETALPERGFEERGEQLAMLSLMLHEKRCDRELETLVEYLSGQELGEADRALVKAHRRFFETEACLPPRLVEKEARLLAEGHGAWIRAREADDFRAFEPVLGEIVDFEREKALAIRPSWDPYDTLLDLYEEGQSAGRIAAVFDPLEERIHDLMDRCADAGIDTSFLHCSCDRDRLHAFCLDVIGRMGFDFSRGMVSTSAHPFTSYLGRDDIRITTRYTDPSFFDAISTIVHECGHALYDMHASLNGDIRNTSIGCGTSMSLHESQSRFWENMIMRSRPFWVCMYPRLQEAVPALAAVSLDDFWRAVNLSCPSAIRVNADELTYPLHIIMRFRLERQLIRGELPVGKLPEAWNRMSLETVRYAVKSDREGCLQDSHWAGGLFGYFPSYALGSIAAASFMKALEKEAGGRQALEADLASGRWSVVTGFQDRMIWRYGAVYGFDETVERVTGKPLTVEDYTAYLADKYSTIYNLQ